MYIYNSNLLSFPLGMVSEQTGPPARRVHGLYGGRQPVAGVVVAGGVHAQAAVLAQQYERALLLAAAAAPVAHRYHVRYLCFRWYHLIRGYKCI